MSSRVLVPVLSCLLLTSTVALADEAASKDPKGIAKKDEGAGDIRRDPEGKTGISPYMETIAKGERAFVSKDLEGARGAFQEAVQLDAGRMLGFYRLGETELALNKLEDAASSFQAALSKKGPADLQAKVLFALADIEERQQKWADAKEAWAKYASFLQENDKAKGYPATADERQKQIDRRVKDEKDYGAVKERIAKRQAEREKEAEENAKKDALNR